MRIKVFRKSNGGVQSSKFKVQSIRFGANFKLGTLNFELGAFLLFFLAVTAPTFASEVFIPRDLATVRDRAEGSNDKTVLIIEEAHVDYGAQKAIADVLRDLAENESLRNIFVEGGWGDVSLTPLRNLTGPERRKEVAEEYLRQGKISGDEYLNLATDLDIGLWGIEDPKLYEANMNVFLRFSSVRPKLLDQLKSFNSKIQNLRSKMLTPATNELLDRRADYESQKLSLLDYIQYLTKRGTGIIFPEGGQALFSSKNEPVPGKMVPVPFPHLAQLMALAGQNGFYDPDKVALERESAVRFLSQKLTKPEIEEILFLKDQKTPEGELCFLEALFTKVRSFPQARRELSLDNLNAYKTILQKTVSMDTSAIFTEIASAEREALAAQKPTQEQQTLLEIIDGVGTLEKLFDLRLTEAEFNVLRPSKTRSSENSKTGSWQGIAKWDGFLAEVCKKYGLSYQPFDATEFSEWIPVALSFYQTARERENAMIENLDREILDRGLTRAALVSGGFHSRNIFDALKNKGYTVLLVSPRFTPSSGTKGQHEQYLEVLRSKWTGNALKDPRTKIQEPNNKIQGNFKY